MTSEKFCLKWNDFESSISHAFREIRDDKDFFDVTLACDDDQIQAHKVILSACSPFFRNILRRNHHTNMLLYLKGVKYADLQSVLNFMYHGEVNVAQEELNSFLAVAEDLRVKGLTQNQGPSASEPKRDLLPKHKTIPSMAPATQPVKKHRPEVTPFNTGDDDIQEVVSVKAEPRENTQQVTSAHHQIYQQQTNSQALAPADDQNMIYQDESYEDYGYEGDAYENTVEQQGMGMEGSKVFVPQEKLEEYIQEKCVLQIDVNGSKYWSCAVCNKYLYQKQDLLRHIESFHVETTPFPCTYCDASFKTRRSVKRHALYVHKKSLQ